MQKSDHGFRLNRANGFGDLRFLCTLIFFLTGFVATVFAEDSWLLLPEPRFMGHKVQIPLANAKATVFAPAKIAEQEMKFPSESEWKSSGKEMVQLQSETAAEADKLLETITPEMVTNGKKVIEYGILRSENPPASLLLLAPGFLKKFQDVFGPALKIVVPNRYTVLVFPELVQDYTIFSPLVMEEWQRGGPKVSLEVFHFAKDGLQAMGTFEEP